MKMIERIISILAPHLASSYIVFCGRTTRWEVIGQDSVLTLKEKKHPAIFAFWHNQAMLVPYYYTRVLKGNKIVPLISLSKDGELISRTVKHLGIDVVRGSSSRRGGQAFLDLARKMKEGCDIGITPDGPRGPRCSVQPGTIMLASKTGAPIIPIAYNVRRKKVLKTWDRFIVPLPFTCGKFVLGEPYYVAGNADEDVLQRGRTELKDRLNRVNILAEKF